VQQTPIILLDEPTAYLDYPSKVAMFMQLRRLAHQEGKTILLSTHDLELALRLCDRIWMLSPESGLLEGTPADFAENKLLDKHFSSDLLQFSTQQILNYSPLTPQT
jgi:iron complex transport system ATP-binding protein